MNGRNVRFLRVPLLAGVVLWLAGCGFQLRGSADLPSYMDRVAIEATDPYSPVARELRRALAAGGAEVVDGREGAHAVVRLTKDLLERQVLSVAVTGKANEYQLRHSIEFAVIDPQGRPLLEKQELQLVRDYFFDTAQVLGKEREDQMLRNDIARDAVGQMLRRMAAAP